MSEYRALPGAEVRDLDSVRHEVEARVVTYGRADAYGSVWLHGVFERSLNAKKPVICLQHDAKQVVGRVVSHQDTREGLDVTFKLADVRTVPEAAKAWSLLADGVLDSFSVGFQREHAVEPVESSQRSSFGELPAKELIRRAKLQEISIVTQPAVPGTMVLALRHELRPLAELEDIFSRHGIGPAGYVTEADMADLSDIFQRHGLRALPPSVSAEELNHLADEYWRAQSA